MLLITSTVAMEVGSFYLRSLDTAQQSRFSVFDFNRIFVWVTLVTVSIFRLLQWKCKKCTNIYSYQSKQVFQQNATFIYIVSIID